MKKTLLTGSPTKDHYELILEDLGKIKGGEIVTQTLFITVDPYLRGVMSKLPVGSPIPSEQAAKVIESKDMDFPVGSIVLTRKGWCDYAKMNPKEVISKNAGGIKIAPNLGSLSPSHLLGACGMPGLTAYFGLQEVCKAKAGETLFVNAAAGAVGSIVGQIAKIKGLRVIASAGNDEKVNWLKNDLKFDYVFNYKKVDTEEALKTAAPNGIDCFFENVGGPASTAVIKKMNLYGRICLCGAISVYNDERPTMVPSFIQYMIYNQIKLEGFLVAKYFDRANEGISQLAQWIKEGKLNVKETVVEGLESTPQAFINLFSGTNMGKMVIKV